MTKFEKTDYDHTDHHTDHKQTIMTRVVKLFFAILCACVFFVGCPATNTPKGVANTAYNALIDNDLKAFTQTLRDNALGFYGNEKGICIIQRRLLGMEVELKEPEWLKTDFDTCGRELRKIYQADVLGKKQGQEIDPFQVIIRTTLLCDFSQPKSCKEPKSESMVCLIAEVQ